MLFYVFYNRSLLFNELYNCDMKLGINYVYLLIEDKYVDCWDRIWFIMSWNMFLFLYYICNKYYSLDLGGYVN